VLFALEEGSVKERSVTHATFAIERNYSASPERVFGAFADPAKKRRWFSGDKEFRPGEFEMDFRVGGRERSSFRTQGVTCTNDTVYRDIVPNRRIVMAYTMTLGDHCISSSHATVELVPSGQGTDLIFTEQAAFFEGADSPKMREEGWSKLLDQLAKALAN
jgi:uncharacterized protein YndB with AHSA1/START domain